MLVSGFAEVKANEIEKKKRKRSKELQKYFYVHDLICPELGRSWPCACS